MLLIIMSTTWSDARCINVSGILGKRQLSLLAKMWRRQCHLRFWAQSPLIKQWVWNMAPFPRVFSPYSVMTVSFTCVQSRFLQCIQTDLYKFCRNLWRWASKLCLEVGGIVSNIQKRSQYMVVVLDWSQGRVLCYSVYCRSQNGWAYRISNVCVVYWKLLKLLWKKNCMPYATVMMLRLWCSRHSWRAARARAVGSISRLYAARVSHLLFMRGTRANCQLRYLRYTVYECVRLFAK